MSFIKDNETLLQFEQSIKRMDSMIKTAKETVLEFEHAIKHLDSVTKHLNQNASDIKTTIHAGMIQNLECLWSREINLLSQVDQVHKVKEEALHHQQAKLSQALGGLQTVLTMASFGMASEKRMADTLEKLRNMELTPEETPYISFKADHMNLRESILNYGQVDGSDQPLMSAFGYPENAPACLKNQEKDDEDMEHDVIPKTVEEVKMACNIAITMPKLSNRTEDWLQKSTPNTKTGVNNNSARQLPVTCPIMQGLSSTSTPCSWLKQNVDIEDVLEDITDNTCSQTATTETSSPGASDKSQAGVSQVDDNNLKGWLSHANECSSSFSSSFLKHVPTDRNSWLLRTSQQWNNVNDQKQKDFFQHVSKESSVWLRSQSNSKHVTFQEQQNGSDLFSHISKDKDCWLQKQNKTSKLGRSDNKPGSITDSSCDASSSCCRKTCLKEGDERWLSTSAASTSLYQLKNVCRANELCGNMSECVSQPDCFTLLFREKFPVKNVVDPTKAFKPLFLQQHDWLSPASQELSVTDQSKEETDDLVHQMQDVSDSMWLMKSSLSTAMIVNTTPSSPIKFKDNKEETNLWLQKAGYTSCPEHNPSVENVVSSTLSSDSSMSDWLLITNEDKVKQEQMIDPEKESEGWSICSDSHSINTDQCAEDIAAAEEYFRKWLL